MTKYQTQKPCPRQWSRSVGLVSYRNVYKTQEINKLIKYRIISYLNVSIDQPIQFNVIIVFTKWIDQDFSNFQPANVEAKLKWEKRGRLGYCISLGRGGGHSWSTKPPSRCRIWLIQKYYLIVTYSLDRDLMRLKIKLPFRGVHDVRTFNVHKLQQLNKWNT